MLTSVVVVCCFIRETQEAYLGLIREIPRDFCNSCLRESREEADLRGDGERVPEKREREEWRNRARESSRCIGDAERES